MGGGASQKRKGHMAEPPPDPRCRCPCRVPEGQGHQGCAPGGTGQGRPPRPPGAQSGQCQVPLPQLPCGCTVHGDPGQTAPKVPSFALMNLLFSAPAQGMSQAQDLVTVKLCGRVGRTRSRGQRGGLPATSSDDGSPEACSSAGTGPPRSRAPTSFRSRSHSSHSRAWSWRRRCWASLAGFTVMCSTLVLPWS